MNTMERSKIEVSPSVGPRFASPRCAALALAAALLASSVRAQSAPTTNFTYEPNFANEGVDIPGIAVGPNATGKTVVWVSAYCGLSCGWPAGSISEIDPLTGTLLVQHPLPPGQWGSTGPTGLAYDAPDANDPNRYLWVAGYNSERIYKVRIELVPPNQTQLVVQSSWATTGGRPIGGLAFDGQHVWLTKSGDSNVYKYNQNGGIVNSYTTTGTHKAGLDSDGTRLFVVDSDAATIQVRSIASFALIGGPYSFPPSDWDEPDGRNGDLGIDPISGEAYWGARGLTQIHKLHLLDAYTPYCFGDGIEVACPCANDGASGNGCGNIAFSGGARLSATGSASVGSDTLVLTSTGMSGLSSLYFQGTSHTAVPFGYGINCLAGVLVRVGLKGVAGGMSTNPSGIDLPLSDKGGLPASGGTRFYQTVYRQVNPACTPVPLSLTNRTNGMAITWRP